jgi:uncharacterized protein involved in tellurium resistance
MLPAGSADRRDGDLMTLTNTEEGMQSEVYSETKGFAVRTIDLDSGCVVELRRGYLTEDMAIAYAARILNLGDRT